MTIGCRHIVILIIELFFLLNLRSAFAQDTEPATGSRNEPQSFQKDVTEGGPDFARVIQVYGRDLAMISSDENAVALFTTRLAGPLNLNEAAGVLRAGPRAAATLPGVAIGKLETAAVRLTAMLALWMTTQAIRQGEAENTGNHDFVNSDQKLLAWLGAREGSSKLLQLLPLLEAQRWARSIPGADVEHPTYDAYRAAVDHAYPETTGTDQAWMPAVEREGSAVLRQRLISELVGAPVPESIRTQMAARYVRQRLQAVMEARILAVAAELERDAILTVYRNWIALHSLRERVRTTAGLTRLCGTWQWTVHNHQNHGDQKGMIVFAAPGEEQPKAASPKEIVALGDLIYLRWELPGGVVQEDSLLFAAEGRRLEGSFVNSAGAWGNITGKRLKGCKGDEETPRPKGRSAPNRSRPKR
ncbi:hypothetical protein YTPLAS18_19620 [Nitrospira sp.]|nr:hypothetical protein YTPLAS18_19620 [Nitrospira sp.]